jgi:hypothetical protein
MRIHPLPLTLLLVVFGSGCADGTLAIMKRPAPARLALAGNAIPSHVSATQYLRAFRDVQCSGARTSGLSLDLGDEPARKSLEVAGEQRIYLFSSEEMWGTQRIAGEPSAADLVGQHCENLVSFITQPDHTYVVTQDTDMRSCKFSVIDENTSSAPPDLSVHDSRLCGQLGTRSADTRKFVPCSHAGDISAMGVVSYSAVCPPTH